MRLWCVADRARLEVEGETARAMLQLAPLTAGLPQGRLQMEVASMLGYGSAAE